MCNPASFVVTKGKVFWSKTSDSHEDIIDEFELGNLDREFSMNLVRVEITPPDNNYQLPISKWVYSTDQDILPEWYDADKCEERARIALTDWIAEKVVLSGEVVEKLTTCKLFVFGTVREVWGGGTVQKVWDGGTVREVLDGGTVREVWGGGTVITYTKLDTSILKHKDAVLIDRSGDTTVCYTGLQN